VTQATLATGRAAGLDAEALDEWFGRRTGGRLSPACRLLLTARESAPPLLRRRLVLHVATEELADGLCQWPGTRGLIQERLGPRALAVGEEDAGRLREQLRALGVAPAEG